MANTLKKLEVVVYHPETLGDAEVVIFGENQANGLEKQWKVEVLNGLAIWLNGLEPAVDKLHGQIDGMTVENPGFVEDDVHEDIQYLFIVQ